MNKMENAIALVVLLDPEDDRAISWARLLTNVFSDVFVVHGVNSWGRLDVVRDEIKTLLNSERPSPLEVSAVFTHRNDDKKDVARILDTIQGEYYRFVFSGPGVPEGDSAGIPIVRNTDPWSLSDQDAKEIHEFVIGIRQDLPSCCKRESFSFLVALAILCQGYLAARGRFDLLGVNAEKAAEYRTPPAEAVARVLDRKWWLAPFQGFDLTSEIRKECNEQSLPSEIARLVDNFGNGDDQCVSAALRKIDVILNQ